MVPRNNNPKLSEKITSEENSFSNDNAHTNSIISQIHTILSFEELREDCLVQSMKEDIKTILKCISSIREELTKINNTADDAKTQERLATAKEYEKFYGNILNELENTDEE